MKIGKLLLSLSLVLALVIPQLVVADVSPTRNVLPDKVDGKIEDGGNATSGGTGYQDTRGRLRWFGNLFPWELEALIRYLTQWNLVP